MKIPFAFWGQGESDLPIVAGLKVLNTDLTEAELQFTLIDSGKNEPVYAYGIVYSKTDPQVTLDTPGAQVSPIGTNFPGTLPVTNTHTITGLDDTSLYYFRVFATNNQGQPAEENTFYSNTAIGETVWNAFTFTYGYQFIKSETPNFDYFNVGSLRGTGANQTEGSWTIDGLTGSNVVVNWDNTLGEQAIKVKVVHTQKTKVYYYHVVDGGLKIDIPKADFPYDQGDLIISIAHDSSIPNTNFNNYTFGGGQSFANGYHGSNAQQRVLRWGPTKWKIWDYMFQGDRNATNPSNNSPSIGTPVDTPDLSECTSWLAAFRNNGQAWSGDNPNEQKLGEFDLSNIVIAYECFKGSNVCGTPGSATSKPLKDANWDSCRVFQDMFLHGGPTPGDFPMTNLDLSGWTFNQNDSITMKGMFFDLQQVVSRGIGNWNVSQVITMHDMFFNNTVHNEDLSSWNVSNVQNMGRMFLSNFQYNQDLSGWNVGNVTANDNFSANVTGWPITKQPPFPFVFTNSNIEQAITDTLAVDATGNTAVAPYGAISTWNTSSITNMSDLFKNKSQFNADISNWDTSNVTDMGSMFKGAAAFNQDIGNWQTGNVDDMSYMFFDATTFNQDLSGWDVGSLSNDPSNVNIVFKGVYRMFYNATSFNTSLNGWNLPSTLTALSDMFYRSGYNANLDAWDTSNIVHMSSIFEQSDFDQDISSWDVSNVTNMNRMFADCPFNHDISSWDVSNVRSMGMMFAYNTAFNQDLSAWDVSSVTNISEMFDNSNFNSPLPNFTLTGDQRGVFRNTPFNQDISGWDVSGVTIFFYMFRNNTAFNQDIGNWDVSGAFNFWNMFLNATSFDQDLSSWRPILGSSTQNFMGGVTLSTANYDALLIGWNAAMEAEYPGGSGYTLTPSWSFGNSVHTTGAAAELAKNNLINTFNWTITDGNP